MKCEWNEILLESVITDIAAGPFGSRLKVSSFVQSGFPIIDGANLKGFKVTDNITKFVTEEKARSLSRSIAKRNDVVVTISGTLGQIAYVPWTSRYPEYLCSQRQFRVTFDAQKVCVPYLVYYFHTHEGQNKILSFANQTGVPALAQPLKNFRKIRVNLPDIETQKRIVSVLSSLDDKIELNNKINANLERQAQALFKAWFVDNPDVSSWQEGTFADLVERAVGGDWGKDLPSGNNTEMVYCIRGADIPEVRVGNKGKMPTRYILPKNYAAKKLMDGDIVVEISGGSPTQSTGRAAVVSAALLSRYDKGMVCSNFCKALKPIAGFSMYMYYYWQHLYEMGMFFSYENGTTGIKNLDIKGFLETEPISIAPVELVRRFDCFVQSLLSEVYANGLENEQLALTRDTLLPYLMPSKDFPEPLGE